MVGVVEDERQAREMQEDNDKLVDWAKRWKMQFNVGMCKVMHFGKGEPKV